MSNISKRQATRWKISGMREAMELYQSCRENKQTEEQAVESVMKCALSMEWTNH